MHFTILFSMPCSQLVALLREVKYLRQYQDPKHPIPESAAAVFQQDETYRKYLQNLDVTVQLYNTVRETLLDVEYPLVEGQLRELDDRLEKAVSQLNWTSEGVWEYIEVTRNEVRDLEHRVRKAKENVTTMQQVMAEWCATPLYQRREDKNCTLLSLEVGGGRWVWCVHIHRTSEGACREAQGRRPCPHCSMLAVCLSLYLCTGSNGCALYRTVKQRNRLGMV